MGRDGGSGGVGGGTEEACRERSLAESADRTLNYSEESGLLCVLCGAPSHLPTLDAADTNRSRLAFFQFCCFTIEGEAARKKISKHIRMNQAH